MRRTKPAKDLSRAEFEAFLSDNGFKFDRRFNRFFDLRREPGEPSILMPAVRRAQGKINRRETIATLLDARVKRIAARTEAAALKAAHEKIAASIAPRCLPPPRADLDGPIAIAALADDFLTLASRTDGVAIADLLRLGWSNEQVYEHLAAARELAYARQGGNAA